jgi:hypothetical protein
MAGLPKKYFKQFPGQLKKAWAAFRKDGGKSKVSAKSAKKSSKKKPKKAKKSYHKQVAKSVAKKGVPKMKKKHHKKSHSAKSRFGSQAGFAPVQVLTAAGMAAAGGVATSFLINKAPKVKELSVGFKSGIQGAAGLAAILFGKKKWMKSLGAGAVIAAVFSASKNILKLDPLAGPSAGAPTLTADQMRRLLGGQMNMPSNVRMNIPAPVRMRGAPVMPFGSGGWSNSWG